VLRSLPALSSKASRRASAAIEHHWGLLRGTCGSPAPDREALHAPLRERTTFGGHCSVGTEGAKAPRLIAHAMAELPIAVIDFGSYTCKAGFAVPEKDPIVLARSAVLRKVHTTPEPAIWAYAAFPIPLARSVFRGSAELGFRMGFWGAPKHRGAGIAAARTITRMYDTCDTSWFPFVRLPHRERGDLFPDKRSRSPQRRPAWMRH
jgi:hypothetical protein